MELFLFILDGKPGYRRTLSEAQSCLEDHFHDDRSISAVQWGDDGDERYGAYLWNTGTGWDEAAPHSGQIIWPVTVAEQEVVTERTRDVALFGEGTAELTLTIRTDRHKAQMSEIISGSAWHEVGLRAFMITKFATNAAQALSSHWTNKEST